MRPTVTCHGPSREKRRCADALPACCKKEAKKKPGNDLLSHRHAAVREYALGEYAVPSAKQGVNFFSFGRAPHERPTISKGRTLRVRGLPLRRRAGRVLRSKSSANCKAGQSLPPLARCCFCARRLRAFRFARSRVWFRSGERCAQEFGDQGAEPWSLRNPHADGQILPCRPSENAAILEAPSPTQPQSSAAGIQPAI